MRHSNNNTNNVAASVIPPTACNNTRQVTFISMFLLLASQFLPSTHSFATAFLLVPPGRTRRSPTTTSIGIISSFKNHQHQDIPISSNPRVSKIHYTLNNAVLSTTTATRTTTQLQAEDQDSKNNDNDGGVSIANNTNVSDSEATALGIAGTFASVIMLYSESVLFQTGCGLPAGPLGLVGATEGLSYLGVVGLVGFSIYTKIRTVSEITDVLLLTY